MGHLILSFGHMYNISSGTCISEYLLQSFVCFLFHFPFFPENSHVDSILSMQMGCNLICTVLADPSILAPADLKVLTGRIVSIKTPTERDFQFLAPQDALDVMFVTE